MTKQKTEKILKQVQNDKGVETGRSMTEMLGTLAIIGVLSIGGIAGFKYAMNKRDVNEIINGVSMMAVTASQQLMLNKNISLREYGRDFAGYSFTTEMVYNGEGYAFVFSGLPESVCEMIVDLKWNKPSDIWVNENPSSECEEENNKISFIFNAVMSPSCGFGDYGGKGGCNTCPSKLSDINDKSLCLGCGGSWGEEGCSGGCADGSFMDSRGRCAPCSLMVGTPAEPEECEKCAKTKYFRMLYQGNSCVPCFKPGPVEWDREECAKCGSLRRYDEETEMCVLVSS